MIRDARPSDCEAMLEIYAPFVRDTAVSFETEVPSLSEFASRVQTTTPIWPWIVCVTPNGDLAGYAYASQHRARPAYRWAVDATVYVEAKHRRMGVGRGLYHSLVALLRLQGFHVAFAGITLPNNASVALHEAIGFEPIGIYRNAGFKLDCWYDVGWWGMQILPPISAPAEPTPASQLRDNTEWQDALALGREFSRVALPSQ